MPERVTRTTKAKSDARIAFGLFHHSDDEDYESYKDVMDDKGMKCLKSFNLGTSSVQVIQSVHLLLASVHFICRGAGHTQHKN